MTFKRGDEFRQQAILSPIEMPSPPRPFTDVERRKLPLDED
jgi:hypothetical protein